MTGKVGILAYGSLIGDPGDELGAATANVLVSGVMTPFKVEFARSSVSRAGGPTLVPVEEGGAQVTARILVLKEHVSEQEARTMLWRRETRRTAGESEEAPQFGLNPVRIEQLRNFRGVGAVFYTRIAPNIRPLTAQRLAELTLASARCGTIPAGRDGISYLIAALKNGIRTPLSTQYEQEVKRQAGAASLAEALELVHNRSARRGCKS